MIKDDAHPLGFVQEAVTDCGLGETSEGVSGRREQRKLAGEAEPAATRRVGHTLGDKPNPSRFRAKIAVYIAYTKVSLAV